MTRVVVTADFHGNPPPEIPDCDLLLIAGDCLPAFNSGHADRIERFVSWLESVPATHIVGIAGNNDFAAVDNLEAVRELPWTFLHHESTVIDGLVIFGSPLANKFGGWPFMKNENGLAEAWGDIPDDVDILVTHGPAHRIRDRVTSGEYVGSLSLRERIYELPDLVLHAFGHIHEDYGSTTWPIPVDGRDDPRWMTSVNGSYVNERYRPGNKPLEVVL